MTDAAETVDFEGKPFHVAERVGVMALMRFAKLAQTGAKPLSMVALAAQYDLLEQCIHPDDWAAFQTHAETVRADGQQLFGVVKDVFGVLADRPTGPQSDSSSGLRTTEPSSTGDSSSPATGPQRVIQRLNDQGRPDLALVVRRREESLTA